MKIQRTGDHYTATLRTDGVLSICEAPTRKEAAAGCYIMRLERLLKKRREKLDSDPLGVVK